MAVKQHHLPLVRASALLPFCQFLEAAGAPVERHLATARMSPGLFEAPECLVPLRQVLMFVDRAANDEGIESIGLLVGERTEIDSLGAFGRAIRRSMTLADAFGFVVGHIQHYNSAERVWLLRDDDRVLICHALCVAGAAGERHGDLFAIMLLIKTIRLALGPKWWPREVCLPETEAERLPHYRAVLATELALHANPFYAVVLERPLLARELIESGNQREGSDDSGFLRSTAPKRDLLASVRQAIEGHLSNGCLDVRTMAECAGLSARTLTRRLAEEGTSYQRLVEQARFGAAVNLLRDDCVRLIDIAYELGYSDPANFTRAFKQWAGMAPSEYRRLCRMGVIPAAPTAPLPAASS